MLTLVVLFFISCSVEASLATSLTVIGGWIGCLMATYPSEKYGRKTTLLANNSMFIIGAALSASGNLPALFVGRFVSGITVLVYIFKRSLFCKALVLGLPALWFPFCCPNCPHKRLEELLPLCFRSVKLVPSSTLLNFRFRSTLPSPYSSLQ